MYMYERGLGVKTRCFVFWFVELSMREAGAEGLAWSYLFVCATQVIHSEWLPGQVPVPWQTMSLVTRLVAIPTPR